MLHLLAENDHSNDRNIFTMTISAIVILLFFFGFFF